MASIKNTYIILLKSEGNAILQYIRLRRKAADTSASEFIIHSQTQINDDSVRATFYMKVIHHLK